MLDPTCPGGFWNRTPSAADGCSWRSLSATERVNAPKPFNPAAQPWVVSCFLRNRPSDDSEPGIAGESLMRGIIRMQKAAEKSLVHEHTTFGHLMRWPKVLSRHGSQAVSRRGCVIPDGQASE
jgi:hypothetical protein